MYLRHRRVAARLIKSGKKRMTQWCHAGDTHATTLNAIYTAPLPHTHHAAACSASGIQNEIDGKALFGDGSEKMADGLIGGGWYVATHERWRR